MIPDAVEPRLHAVPATIVRYDGCDLVTLVEDNGGYLSGGCVVHVQRMGRREMEAVAVAILSHLIALGAVQPEESVDETITRLDTLVREPTSPF